jgi:[acyl-carrier-protein] S-malonyltransferase
MGNEENLLNRMERKMSKVAFVFSGQGSQYVGMGEELYFFHQEARQVFKDTDKVLGYSLSKLCFNGPQADLNRTENTQPAILAVSLAAYQVLKANGVFPDLVAGFSLGEYSALVCSEVLAYGEAVKLVRKRGLFMEEAFPEGQGGMAAVLGLETAQVERACQSVDGIVSIANYNCPGQIVISGEKEALEEASAKLLEFGAKRIIPLKVSGPFHTPLMQPAAVKLKAELTFLKFQEPKFPLLSNVTADYIENVTELKELLIRQVKSPVLWEMIIRKMLSEGVDTFVEIGPGSTLRGFIKKINRNVTLLNVEDERSLNKTLQHLIRLQGTQKKKAEEMYVKRENSAS